MDSVNIADWKVSHPHCFIALELILPARTVRLTSGGTVAFGGNTYLPEDDDIGALSAVGEIEEGETGEATAPDLTFATYTDDGLVELSGAQGSAWTVYWGTINPATGAVIGTPETVTRGYLNVSRVGFAPGSRALTISSYTEEQFQLLDDSQKRLSPSFHKSIWSGETGLDNVTEFNRKVFWRADDPPRSIAFGGGGGGPGGGGQNNRLV
jgi:hypothetical protein